MTHSNPALRPHRTRRTTADLLSAARALDREDPLSAWREAFHWPKMSTGERILYFTGNSLGLQPRVAAQRVKEVLSAWATLGVDGHFTGDRPFTTYHRPLAKRLAPLVGAEAREVTVMNSLTVNLHLLLSAFYRPEPGKFRILMEPHAFPSDSHVVASHLALHGVDPEAAILVPGADDVPGAGNVLSNGTLSDGALSASLDMHGPEIALSLIGGVNYWTGQFMDMKGITARLHDVGVLAGWDLAHAAGNVPLELHAWNVDFAAWCTYKYLNSGPGGPSAIFVHERHTARPHVAGWWGVDLAERFRMDPTFRAADGAEGWQLSNPSILMLAGLDAALDAFDAVGMTALREKSVRLTRFLEDALAERLPDDIGIITPAGPDERGAQLSLRVLRGRGRHVYNALQDRGVRCDWREPDIIRAAPVPLYNSFEDVARLASHLEAVIRDVHGT